MFRYCFLKTIFKKQSYKKYKIQKTTICSFSVFWEKKNLVDAFIIKKKKIHLVRESGLGMGIEVKVSIQDRE